MIKSSFPVPEYSTKSLYGIYSNLPADAIRSEYTILSDCLGQLGKGSVDVANSVSYEIVSYLLSVMRDVLADRYLQSVGQ